MRLSFKDLFCEVDYNVSLGRVSFWVCFCIAIFFWLSKPVIDFPPSLLEMLFILVSYNFAKQGLGTWKGIKYQEFLNKQKTLFSADGTLKRQDFSEEDK